MALTVVWEKCAVDKPVERSKEGAVVRTETVILKRNDALPDYVSDFVASTLTQIGAVRDLGLAVEAVQAAVDAETADPVPPPVYPAEVPPVTNQPPAANVDPNATQPEGGSTDGPLSKPSTSDNKDAWERYAVEKRYFTAEEAESMTKTKLIAEVNKKESAPA